MISISLRQAMTRCMPKHHRHGLATGWMNQGTDWGQTQPFLIPDFNEAYLRLNLAGREPQGIVPLAMRRRSCAGCRPSWGCFTTRRTASSRPSG